MSCLAAARANRRGSAPSGAEHVRDDGLAGGRDLKAAVHLCDFFDGGSRRKVAQQLIDEVQPSVTALKLFCLDLQVRRDVPEVLDREVCHWGILGRRCAVRQGT